MSILKSSAGPSTTPLANAVSVGIAPTDPVTAEQVQLAQTVLAAAQAAPATTLAVSAETQAVGPPAVPAVSRKVIPLADAVERAAGAPGAEPSMLPQLPPKESMMVRVVIPDAPPRAAPATATAATPVSTATLTAPAASSTVEKAALPPPPSK